MTLFNAQCNSSPSFSISFIALEDCCIAVISSSSDKLSFITSYCETQRNSTSSSVVNYWLCSSTSSPISLLSISSPLILAEDTISLSIGFTGYCLGLLNVTFDNILRPKLLPSRSEDSLGNLFPCIFDHLRQETMWK
ncbi:hypothetical protein AVEN_148462-1 [Araneus ventricosus]|uniref:Uncharacterized protein n=1 Tax=Araneus ventricosus TaxID=182803 RepID=A0A4Y2SXP3_ARAVE|nr:hypothetical protein AVEN_237055-1 [Araneus ventricosus]GBN92733.1 hypothetical protein AVEN_148462-1 [Araneus ventricosus]